MTCEDIPAQLARHNVSRESLEKLKVYVDVLRRWQQRINLIGPSTEADIWTRHILDAVQLLPLMPERTRVIADLGSGAGIPGLVLAIAANVRVHLYESNGKKAAFLREASRMTGAAVDVHCVRLETLSGSRDCPAVQVVTARALAPLPQLLDYADVFLKTGALGLFHKGQDVDIELTDATRYRRLQIRKIPSVSDSRGVILEVREVHSE